MMRSLGNCSTVLWILLLVGCSGGGGSTAPSDGSPSTENSAAASSAAVTSDGLDPKAVVTAFLESFKAGDPEGTSKYLTKAALEDAKLHDMEIQPPGSPNAKFQVGEAEYVGDGKEAVHVATSYEEPDESGQSITRNVVWGLTRQPEGWRIAGMAIRVFDDLPPLLLDFENQEEMQQKLLKVQEEMIRRAQAANAPAGEPGAARQAQQPAGTATR